MKHGRGSNKQVGVTEKKKAQLEEQILLVRMGGEACELNSGLNIILRSCPIPK